MKRIARNSLSRLFRKSFLPTAGVGLAVYLARCAGAAGPGSTATADGAALAGRYCQSCHVKPDPSLLPKDRWSQSVLPVMGLFLGMTPVTAQANPVERSVFPSGPAMTPEQWQALTDYYVSNAPERLPPQAPTPTITKGLPRFSVQLPKDSFLYGTASVTSLCRIDTNTKPHGLYIGNSMSGQLFAFNGQLALTKKRRLAGPVVDLCFYQNSPVSCHIGTDVRANDSSNGFVQYLNNAGSNTKNVLFDSLSRPVQLQVTDLNGDGKPDFLIAQFGNLKGQLTWMKNNGKGGFVPQAIKDGAGAIRFVVKDANGDGRPDVYALFAQGDERLLLFINKGNGRFDENILLRFPPSYGSTYFDLVDFDGDGDDDVVYTCGDNGDYSRVLKPYHGVYIFLNDGKNRFTQRTFYPVNGCFKALCRDFDRDGDMDIATISYFPSSATPWESFVYLENNGNFSFKPYTLPDGTPFQKGVTMDAGDLNGDGKVDLVLGSGYYTGNVVNGEKQPLFLVLYGK